LLKGGSIPGMTYDRSAETYTPTNGGIDVPFNVEKPASPLFVFGITQQSDRNNDQGISTPSYVRQTSQSQERPSPFLFGAHSETARVPSIPESPTLLGMHQETAHSSQQAYTQPVGSAADQPAGAGAGVFQFGTQNQETANSTQQAIWESAPPPPKATVHQAGPTTATSSHTDQGDVPGNVFFFGRAEQVHTAAGPDPSVNLTATHEESTAGCTNRFATGHSSLSRRKQPRGRRIVPVQAEQHIPASAEGAAGEQQQPPSCSSSAYHPTSEEPEKVAATPMQSLEKARACAAAARFPEAAKACLAAIGGPIEAVELLREQLENWEGMERQKIVSQENLKGQLTAQLMDARDRVNDMRSQRDDKAAEVATERRRREEAERELSRLRHLYGDLQRERERLNEQLRRSNEQRSRLVNSAAGPPSTADVVQHLARKECEPLRNCNTAARQALKKKILLKWHPDKQPCVDHSGFATQVMQEVQNREEWNW